MKRTKESNLLQGPYDHLYSATQYLWPLRPGRMVKRAVEIASPGRALDLGCGDGKHLVYLQEMGWCVDGVDISQIALAKARERIATHCGLLSGNLLCNDVVSAPINLQQYKLIIMYGLCHCLDERKYLSLWNNIRSNATHGTIVAYASFDDGLPIPKEHGTGALYLRSRERVLSSFGGMTVHCTETGTIQERHGAGELHEHSMTWVLAEVV